MIGKSVRAGISLLIMTGKGEKMRKLSACCLLLLLACSGGGSRSKVDSIILVTIDTCRADRIGCYGNGRACTPCIDRLAAEGIQFSECFVQVPTTLSSHATLLTSLYPRTHGIPRNGFTLDGEVRTIAQIFSDNGFHTAAFLGAFPLAAPFGLNRGFDLYDDDLDMRTKGGELERRGDQVADGVCSWLTGVGAEPFFLWAHFFDPHWPYDPVEPYGSIRRTAPLKYDPTSLDDMLAIRSRRVKLTDEDLEGFLANYDGEIAFVDRNIQRILDAVPEERREKLLVVVTSDHGEGFGEHHYYFDHGEYLWESSVHVPLILHSPILFPEPFVPESPVRLMDIAPTLLESAGIRVPRSFEGKSLMSAAGNRVEPRTVICEASKPWNTEIEGEYQNKYKSKMVRTDRWKYVVSPYLDRKELYDLIEDPEENRNLIHKEKETAARLEKVLVDWMRERDPGFEPGDLTANREVQENLKALGYF